MNERIGIIQFILLLIGMNLTFMPMHFLGVEGMPRRIYTYGAEQGWTYWNQVTTIGAYIQAVSFALFAYNLDALRKPKSCGSLECKLTRTFYQKHKSTRRGNQNIKNFYRLNKSWGWVSNYLTRRNNVVDN